MNVLNAVGATPVRPDAGVANDGRVRPEASDRAPTGAEFSALLALLNSAGVLGAALPDAQAMSNPAALLDRLLNGTLATASQAQDGMDANTGAMTRQADALRYGILSEQGASAMRASAAAVPGGAATLDALLAQVGTPTAVARNARLAAGTPTIDTPATGAPATGAPATGAPATGAPASNGGMASAGASRDVTAATADLNALSPALRDKLDRVIARMQQEYGHTVRVVETSRTQERQDYLYAQGRTRPGAVVTWTRDSAHTRGEAADVTIDGSYTNAEAFARLQRIASEEGLRTLGMQDPGHLQLARAGQAAPSVSTPMAATRNATMVAAGPAGTAHVAGVAGVAGLAGIARTAAPARGAAPMGARESTVASTGQGASVGTVATLALGTRGGSTEGFRDGARDGDARGSLASRKGVARDAARDPMAMTADARAFGSLSALAPSSAEAGVAVAPGSGVLAAARVADIQQLRDDAPAGTMSRITVQLDGANGGQDQITVDLRGDTVQTQIRTDAAQADRLRLRTGELQDALGRHGLEGDGVRIAATARPDGADTVRLAGGERDGANSGMRLAFAQQASTGDNGFAQGQRDRAATARDWDRHTPDRSSRDEGDAMPQDRDRQRGRRDTNSRSAT